MTHSDNGFFDNFGGKYVAEVLRRPLDELEVAFKEAMADPAFVNELETIQRDYIGRETPLLFAETATRLLGGAQPQRAERRQRDTQFALAHTDFLL